MFGTLTLKGIQKRNRFVDEISREYRLINSWTAPNYEVEKFVLLRKFNDEAWYVMRSLELNRRKVEQIYLFVKFRDLKSREW